MTGTVSRPPLLASALALALGAPGCSAGDDGTASPKDASLTDASDSGSAPCLLCSEGGFDGPIELHVRGVLDQVCGNIDGCHGGGAGNFGVLPGSEFDAMINVPSFEKPALMRVAPGDPAHSYVYLKLACDGGIVLACMPLDNPDPSLAQLFHDWIEAGAKVP